MHATDAPDTPHRSTGTPCGRDPDDAASRVASLVTAATLAVAFGGMALGVPWFWVAFPVGFGGVLPVAVGMARRGAGEDRRRDGDGEDPALATVRERYARGEIDEVEFEARVEALLATEDR